MNDIEGDRSGGRSFVNLVKTPEEKQRLIEAQYQDHKKRTVLRSDTTMNLTRKRWHLLVVGCVINLFAGSLYAWSVFGAALADR